MKNVAVSIKGSIATITVDLSKSFGPSASGKTEIVASTSGNVPIGQNPEGKMVTLGLNAYTKA